MLYAGQSQFDKARAALEMAIRTNPSYATAHENLGDVYAKLASQAYSKALQLDAGNAAVQPKLALIRELFAPGARGGQAQGAGCDGARTGSGRGRQGSGCCARSCRPGCSLPLLAASAAASAPAAAPAPAPAKAPAAAPAPAAPPASAAAREVEDAVHAWAKAWSAKDMEAYLAAYGKDFDPPGKQSRKAWEEERRSRIVPRARISVRLSDIGIDVNGSKATAKFRQAYSADGLNVSGNKTLELQKVGDRWLIVRESVG